MFVLASGPTPSYKKLADMPLLVAIDFEGGTSKATLNEAGIAILDPNDLEALDANSTEFASKIRTCHMLVAGREHCHPSVMAEKKMQIYKNDKHTDRPRWKFCLGPRPGIQKWIHKRGRYYQQLAADTETGISADRVAAWLMQKLHDVKPDAGYIASWPITMAGSRLDVPELNVSRTSQEFSCAALTW